MKISLFICSFMLCFALSAQKVDSFTVKINDVDCNVIPEGSNVDALPNHILGAAPSDIRVNRKGGTWGLGQLIHIYLAKNQWYSVENNFLFTPFDFRQRSTEQEKHNFYRIELKSTSSFYFSKKEKMKPSSMNIKDKAGKIHQLSFDWPSTIRNGARFGLEYQQYSMNEIEKENLIIDNQNIVRSTQLMGQKQVVFSAGLVRQQVKGFKCDFCELGPYDSFNIREFYIDGLIAPFQHVYGKVADSIAFSEVEYRVDQKRLTDYNYEMVRIGGRIGFRRMGVWAKLPQVLMSFGGELGWYTGPSVYNFEVGLKMGVYFRSVKGLFKDSLGLIR